MNVVELCPCLSVDKPLPREEVAQRIGNLFVVAPLEEIVSDFSPSPEHQERGRAEVPRASTEAAHWRQAAFHASAAKAPDMPEMQGTIHDSELLSHLSALGIAEAA